MQKLLDQELWDDAAQKLSNVKAGFTPESVASAVRVAIRAAAAVTGAIEGLYTITPGATLAAARQEQGWEAEIAQGGTNALALFGAQLSAYEMAQVWAASPTGLAEASVRQLQAELRKPEAELDPSLELGVFKSQPNCVQRPSGRIHRYALPSQVRPEISQVMKELRSKRFQNSHPVLRASYAHYCLAAIHPFSDGNGRVARAISSALLHNAVGLPLLVDFEQRNAYLAALEAADNGEWQPFVDFIFDCSLDTMRFVADEVMGSPQTEVKRLWDIMTAQSGLTFQQVNTVSASVMQGVLDEFQSQLGAMALPSGTSFDLGWGSTAISAVGDENKYRGNQGLNAQLLGVNLRTTEPAGANQSIQVVMGIAKDADDRFPLVVRELGTDERFLIRLQDVRPETASYRLLRGAWVRKLLTRGLKALADTAAARKAASGY